MQILFKVGYYVILILLIVVAGILFLPILPIEGNIQTKVVLSGSMEPSIKVGSVIVLKPQESYSVGDTITFGRDTRTSIPTTHRIVESRIQNGELLFKTKGDANQDPDIRETREEDVIGKVQFSIPYLGYAVDFAKTRLGFLLIVIIPGAIIMIDEVWKIFKEVKGMRKKKEKI